jgi:hypothetical protein
MILNNRISSACRFGCMMERKLFIKLTLFINCMLFLLASLNCLADPVVLPMQHISSLSQITLALEDHNVSLNSAAIAWDADETIFRRQLQIPTIEGVVEKTHLIDNTYIYFSKSPHYYSSYRIAHKKLFGDTVGDFNKYRHAFETNEDGSLKLLDGKPDPRMFWEILAIQNGMVSEDPCIHQYESMDSNEATREALQPMLDSAAYVGICSVGRLKQVKTDALQQLYDWHVDGEHWTTGPKKAVSAITTLSMLDVKAEESPVNVETLVIIENAKYYLENLQTEIDSIDWDSMQRSANPRYMISDNLRVLPIYFDMSDDETQNSDDMLKEFLKFYSGNHNEIKK